MEFRLRTKDGNYKWVLGRGMIPICSSCKNIRDDKGFWSQVEEYIQLHSQAEFTHSICPDCAEKIYGDEDWFYRKDFP